MEPQRVYDLVAKAPHKFRGSMEAQVATMKEHVFRMLMVEVREIRESLAS